MSNWKPESYAGGFFYLFPAAEAMMKVGKGVEKAMKTVENNWHESKRMNKTMRERSGEAMMHDQKRD